MPHKDRAARNAYARGWYAKNSDAHKARVAPTRDAQRLWLSAFKATLKCQRCPEDNPVCLDFHHRDPAEKEISIYQAMRQRWSQEKVLAEIAKCDVLCANCHRKEHERRRQEEARRAAGLEIGCAGSI